MTVPCCSSASLDLGLKSHSQTGLNLETERVVPCSGQPSALCSATREPPVKSMCDFEVSECGDVWEWHVKPTQLESYSLITIIELELSRFCIVFVPIRRLVFHFCFIQNSVSPTYVYRNPLPLSYRYLQPSSVPWNDENH
jgi:hypothetical protein